YPDALVRWRAIREIVPSGTPPEIRTYQGEVLFVSALQKDVLIEVAQTHNIPLVQRVDVWSLILEPFLDTELDEQMKLFTQHKLAENGVSRVYCTQLRERFGPIMYVYNFDTLLWEWVHLGLYDLLCAHKMFRRHLIPADQDFNVVYWEAMEIAERGQLIWSES
ncbi:MAG: hypothetical protein AAGF95_17380, partial [Chloroflexota bacterium]